MSKVARLFSLALIMVLIMSVTPQALAQDDGEYIISPTFGSGPGTLHPLFCQDTTCSDLLGRMFYGLVGVDPQSMVITKNVPGGLAEDWTVSEDKLTYTFKLRDGIKWTDGTPVTAKDVEFSYNTVIDPKSESELASFYTTVESVTAPDDKTVVIKYNVADCTALSAAGSIPVAPAHILKDTPVEELKEGEYATAPSVTSGVYKFGEFRPSEQTVLLANPDNIDLIEGKIDNAGLIQPVVPDQTVQIEQFLAGQVNVVDNIPVDRRADLRKEQEAGNVQLFDYPGNAWDYLAMNLADPTDPQPGQDESGKLIEQKPHPIFGDVAVRQAIAHAINVDDLIKAAVFGEGSRMASFIIPSSWAINKDLKPRAFDPAKAGEMLDAAGWPMGPDGVRVSKGAKFAPDGTVLEFDLNTNAGNTRRETASALIADQLKEVGIKVNFTPMEFQALLDLQNSQKWDTILLGWRNSFPDDPDAKGLFHPINDIPGSGNNFTSYTNPKVDALWDQALTVDGCGTAERAALYGEIQEMMYEDVPYVWLYVINGMYGARSVVKDWGPLPNQLYWNVETWDVEAN